MKEATFESMTELAKAKAAQRQHDHIAVLVKKDKRQVAAILEGEIEPKKVKKWVQEQGELSHYYIIRRSLFTDPQELRDKLSECVSTYWEKRKDVSAMVECMKKAREKLKKGCFVVEEHKKRHSQACIVFDDGEVMQIEGSFRTAFNIWGSLQVVLEEEDGL